MPLAAKINPERSSRGQMDRECDTSRPSGFPRWPADALYRSLQKVLLFLHSLHGLNEFGHPRVLHILVVDKLGALQKGL